MNLGGKMSHEIIKNAQDVAKVIGDVLTIVKDHPLGKEAGRNLAQTAVTVTETINTVLLPFRGANYLAKKFEEYLSEKFEFDMRVKLAHVPPEHIVEPQRLIAGQIMRELECAYEEPDIKELYLNLLAKAMDDRSASDVHPAFIDVVRQMSSKDAYYLKRVFENEALPIVQLKLVKAGGVFNVFGRHIVNLQEMSLPEADRVSRGVNQKFDSQLPALVDNWIRLGLVEVDYRSRFTDMAAYDWVEKIQKYFLFMLYTLNLKRKLELTMG
ncbi:MAG: DUF4393 domain-containing protein [Magnetococcales bacterium]|nr:DUF4393 domain-containing protein [Magnetococcales bacterium]